VYVNPSPNCPLLEKILKKKKNFKNYKINSLIPQQYGLKSSVSKQLHSCEQYISFIVFPESKFKESIIEVGKIE
jgi:hypothetical protein